MTTLTRADDKKPGTYVQYSAGGRIQIQVLCPQCGNATSLVESELDTFGETWQKFTCPYYGCTFLDHLHLAGFAEVTA